MVLVMARLPASQSRAPAPICARTATRPFSRLPPSARLPPLPQRHSQLNASLRASQAAITSGRQLCLAPCRGLASRTSKAAVLATSTTEVQSIKDELTTLLEGEERGIFGIKSGKRQQIHELVEQLEALNPQPQTMANPECVAGKWEVLYSTIKITGSKRTKLGLREFVKISDMRQSIDIGSRTADNEVQFSVMGLGDFAGTLSILASWEVASHSRVDIKFVKSTLEPPQLQKIFEMTYDILLEIFNPEGWLDITYVDATHRVGRDDKGNLFLLERC